MATRSEWNLRIKEANARVVRNTKEAQQVMDELLTAAMGDIKEAILAAISDCYSRLVVRTPVDTGRARASWHIAGEQDEWKPAPGDYPEARENVSSIIEKEIRKLQLSLSESDIVYIMSNIEYMLPLEAGWSKKQGGGFIALFLTELKTSLESAASKMQSASK